MRRYSRGREMGASQSQLEQKPKPEPQAQERPQEPNRRESGLSSQGNTIPSNNSKKAVDDHDAKPNKTQSMTPVKHLKGSLTNLPHNCEHILKDADSPLNSTGNLLDQLHDGVFLDHKTKKYWLEKGSNCFTLYARALSITWGENPHYWKWVQHKEESVEVAELKMVCWLEARVNFDTRKLSPGIPYQVSFSVKLKDSAEGWNAPVNVRLVPPGGGNKQQNQVSFNQIPKESWIQIPVGEFVPSEKEDGVLEISLYEYSGIWKTGLVIKGVVIKPKNK